MVGLAVFSSTGAAGAALLIQGEKL